MKEFALMKGIDEEYVHEFRFFQIKICKIKTPANKN